MDREKILSAFDKCCHAIPCDTCEWDACQKLRMPIPRMHIPYDLCIAVLALLKEQADEIRQLKLAMQIMKGVGVKVDTEGR